MWNNTVDNKTRNLNFCVTFDLSDESRERSSPSNNSAELRFRLFSKRSTVAEKFRIAKLVLSLSHPYTFHRGGSTRLKSTWVQHRQHHRAQESARERMLSLLLRVGWIPTLHLKTFSGQRLDGKIQEKHSGKRNRDTFATVLFSFRSVTRVPRKLDQTVLFLCIDLSRTCDSPGGTPSVITQWPHSLEINEWLLLIDI